MPEIYFACFIRGGRDDAPAYAELVAHIKERAVVLSEIFADGTLTALGMDKPSRDIWQTDTNWIRQSDGVIAEVTNPSLGVGYEIALAETIGKPVLALFRHSEEKRLSAMIEGAPGVRVCTYRELSVAKAAINDFIDRLDG